MNWTIHFHGGPRRASHAAVCIGDKIYSIGGYSTSDDYQFGGSIDVYVLNTSTLRWALIPPMDNGGGSPLNYPEVPFQRDGHTTVAYQGKVYMWGGRNHQTACNILYCFDPGTHSWTRPSVRGTIPNGRTGHAACIVDNFMYMFGGYLEEIGQFSNDVYCLDLDTFDWRYIKTFGAPPSGRNIKSTAAIKGRMYLYGASSPYYSQDEKYCSLIVYLDLKSKVWHRLSTIGGVPINHRFHSMTVYKGLIYVFGVPNVHQRFNELYIFDPTINTWKLVKPRGTPPSTRSKAVCVVKDHRIFVFGGYCYDPNDDSVTYTNDDTHVLEHEPSLRSLAIQVVIDNHLDTSELPKNLKEEIHAMIEKNSLIRAYYADEF